MYLNLNLSTKNWATLARRWFTVVWELQVLLREARWEFFLWSSWVSRYPCYCCHSPCANLNYKCNRILLAVLVNKIQVSLLTVVWFSNFRYVVLIEETERKGVTLVASWVCILVVLWSHSETKSFPLYLVAFTLFALLTTLLANSIPLLFYWLEFRTCTTFRFSFCHFWSPKKSTFASFGQGRSFNLSLSDLSLGRVTRFENYLNFKFCLRISIFFRATI